MDEFNFFGAKGELRDIRGLIDERVEKRITDEKATEKQKAELETYATELEQARKSGESAASRADENLKLAQEFFGRLQKMSEQQESTARELRFYKRRAEIQSARNEYIHRHRKMRLRAENIATNESKADNESMQDVDSSVETSLPKSAGKDM